VSTRSIYLFAKRVYANTRASAQVRVSVNSQRKTSARVLAANTLPASTRSSVKRALHVTPAAPHA